MLFRSPDFLQSCGRLLSAWGCRPFRPVLWLKHGIRYKRVFSLHSHFLLARKAKSNGYCPYQVFKVQFNFILSHAVKEYKDIRRRCALPCAGWWFAAASESHPDSPYPQVHNITPLSVNHAQSRGSSCSDSSVPLPPLYVLAIPRHCRFSAPVKTAASWTSPSD